MGATLRLVGYAAQGLAARSPQFNFILYLLPLGGILIAAAAPDVLLQTKIIVPAFASAAIVHARIATGSTANTSAILS